MLNYIVIDKTNVEHFVSLCSLQLRRSLLVNAFHYPPGLNAIGAIDEKENPVGLIFTLRNPDSTEELLQSLHTSLTLPDGLTVLEQLMQHLIEHARLRNSKSITASFFESPNGKILPENALLQPIFENAGFEPPRPYKINHKIKVDLLNKEKYLLHYFNFGFSFLSYAQYGHILPEQLPPHPPELQPFIKNYDPHISQLLVKENKIRGWLAARRISPVSVFYQTLFVDEESQQFYAAPLLIRRACAMQIENHYSDFAVFSAPLNNTGMAHIIARHWKECSVDIVQENLVVKLL
ncbi:MAG: hypothetical protein LBC02_09355 [Planctomycetaceae bacterium]|nr:hypothetical protein [Planctomycetaceae bacterium]